MLSFFPWLQIEARKTFGEFELIPYAREEENEGISTDEASAIDLTTESYVTQKDNPVSELTLIRKIGASMTVDLDEPTRESMFLFAEFLSISCLAKREFFSRGMYCNRDNFNLIIQGFKEPGNGFAIRSRRRDGGTTGYWSRGLYQFQQPEHVSSRDAVKIDEDLLKAIIAAEGLPESVAMVDAITLFNLANKDSSEMRDIVEIVLLISAFERLISPRMGDEHALTQALAEILLPKANMKLESCSRITPEILTRFKHAATVREIWIRDAFRIRGNHAHGKIVSPYPAVWSTMNHLLLGSFIFPVVLKLWLARQGKYKTTDLDEIAIEAFESLCCEEHFRHMDPIERADPTEHRWNDILSATGSEIRKRTILKQLADEELK